MDGKHKSRNGCEHCFAIERAGVSERYDQLQCIIDCSGCGKETSHALTRMILSGKPARQGWRQRRRMVRVFDTGA